MQSFCKHVRICMSDSYISHVCTCYFDGQSCVYMYCSYVSCLYTCYFHVNCVLIYQSCINIVCSCMYIPLWKCIYMFMYGHIFGLNDVNSFSVFKKNTHFDDPMFTLKAVRPEVVGVW